MTSVRSRRVADTSVLTLLIGGSADAAPVMSAFTDGRRGRHRDHVFIGRRHRTTRSPERRSQMLVMQLLLPLTTATVSGVFANLLLLVMVMMLNV